MHPTRRATPFRTALLLAVAGCAVPPTPTTSPVAEPATTVLIVRHTERASQMASDPELSEAGRVRAAALADSLASVPIAAIFSTQFRRTRETAGAVAARVGVPVTVRPASAENTATYAQDLAREVLAAHAGRTVLVVGHSNTVPALVAAFGGQPTPTLADGDYGDLFRVSVPRGGAARMERSRFGADRAP